MWIISVFVIFGIFFRSMCLWYNRVIIRLLIILFCLMMVLVILVCNVSNVLCVDFVLVW